ncbi:LacI family DNA-binding transcriptional regulator [Aliiroseovarius crassostreae]|uniref:LacI family DNA-binding transcriptional regulator n=1 Tax=Aliiroseovarius crassostreae TaxID=154981 RepID=UPI003C7A137D
MDFDEKNAPSTVSPPVLRRARFSEIARLAGVGTATVDRVLNNRPNVRAETRQRVLQAKHAIETGADLNHQVRPWRLKVFLPEEAGPSTEFLADCFQNVNTGGRAIIECVFSTKLEPTVLARRLRACAGQGIDAVGFQALDDPRVRSAIEELAGFNIPCVPIVSGMVSQHLTGFIGIDNMSAGKTAGFLMGRMVRQAGPVAIISGGELYRVHTDREMGFRAVLRKDFRHLEVVGTFTGHDDNEGNRETVADILRRHPDLVGIYNVGGAITGIVEALKDQQLDGEVMFIGHNLTPTTSTYLLDGSMDVVVHQNMRRVAEQTVQTLIARLENRSYEMEMIPVEVITRENILGATFG